MVRSVVFSVVAAMSLLSYGSGAFAMNYNAQKREEQKRACEADVMKFCKDDMPDEAKITACMKSNKPKLSAGCLQMFKEAGQ